MFSRGAPRFRPRRADSALRSRGIEGKALLGCRRHCERAPRHPLPKTTSMAISEVEPLVTHARSGLGFAFHHLSLGVPGVVLMQTHRAPPGGGICVSIWTVELTTLKRRSRRWPSARCLAVSRRNDCNADISADASARSSWRNPGPNVNRAVSSAGGGRRGNRITFDIGAPSQSELSSPKPLSAFFNSLTTIFQPFLLTWICAFPSVMRACLFVSEPDDEYSQCPSRFHS